MIKNTTILFGLASTAIGLGAWLFPVNSPSNINTTSNIISGSNNVVNSNIVTTNIVNNGNSSVNIVNSPAQSFIPASESIQTHTETLPEKMNNAPTLLVSGTGAKVKILIGPDDAPFSGGKVTSSNTEGTIYVSRGQKINLKLTGTGAKVWVQSELMPYINVTNTALGGKVREL
ncbi:hypothetical protein [Marinomonas sp.]|uniref:hypothetical protein n=1 Tax=Marinomonas sp. TaxID=1904862 RepID=UPI003BAA3372